ncbi:MAG: hypothetical protein GY853_14095 [PVC group bacterium]|nr:hypothetical protein [PVC group bacterium]
MNKPVGGRKNPAYFCVRDSENYYSSGMGWTIPVDTEGLIVVTLREVKK